MSLNLRATGANADPVSVALPSKAYQMLVSDPKVVGRFIGAFGKALDGRKPIGDLVDVHVSLHRNDALDDGGEHVWRRIVQVMPAMRRLGDGVAEDE